MAGNEKARTGRASKVGRLEPIFAQSSALIMAMLSVSTITGSPAVSVWPAPKAKIQDPPNVEADKPAVAPMVKVTVAADNGLLMFNDESIGARVGVARI